MLKLGLQGFIGLTCHLLWIEEVVFMKKRKLNYFDFIWFQSFEEHNGYVAPSYDEESSSGNRLKMKLKEFHKRYQFDLS